MPRAAVDVTRSIAVDDSRHAAWSPSGRSWLWAGVASMVVLNLASPARAVDYFWLNPVGGFFHQPALWSPFDPLPPGVLLGPGGAADTANFNLGVTPANRYTVVDVHGENEQLLIHNDSLRLEITGYSLLTDDQDLASLAVGVADGDTGDLILTGIGGAALQQNRRTTIGQAAGSTGIVTVENLTWTNEDSTLIVGQEGTGTLIIENGGAVSGWKGSIGLGIGSNGTAVVRGADATWDNYWIVVGDRGTGALTIEDGGHVTVSKTDIGIFNSHGTLTVRGAGSTWSSGLAGVGYKGDAELRIEDGAVATSGRAWLGGLPGDVFNPATSTATVTGTGSLWTVAPDLSCNCDGSLTVGLVNASTLTIERGGRISNTDAWLGFQAESIGTVVIRGIGSNWTNTGDLFIGQEGTGHLTIEARGSVSNATGSIGAAAGSTGAVTVRDAGTRWTNDGELFVGNFGAGQFRIEAGGLVFNNGTWIGTSPGSTGTATVTGFRSTWNTSGQFIVGYRARGTMTVDAGGSVLNDGDSFIGYTLPTDSVAAVTGADSKWTNTGNLVVAHSGTGSLRISAGGKVSNVDGVIGNNIQSIGVAIVTGAGSTWTNGGALAVGNSGTGTLIVQDGGVVSAADGMTVGLQGLVAGNGTIITDVTNAGMVAPGNSPGALRVTGDFHQLAAGHLAIEIGGLLPGSQYDQLLVSGDLTLDGVLDLALIDGFQPQTGNIFKIVSAGDLNGRFASVAGQDIGGGLLLNTVYTATSVSLLVAIPGDANLNGEVNFADLGILLNNFNHPGVWTDGDFDNTNEVNFADLGILLNHYDQSVLPMSAAAAPVPEPTGLAIGACALFGLLSCAYRRSLLGMKY